MRKYVFIFLIMTFCVSANAHEVVKIGDRMQRMRDLHGIEDNVATVETRTGDKTYLSSAHYYNDEKLIFVYDGSFVCKIIIGSTKDLSKEDDWCDSLTEQSGK